MCCSFGPLVGLREQPVVTGAPCFMRTPPPNTQTKPVEASMNSPESSWKYAASLHPTIAWVKRNPQKAVLLPGVVVFAIMGIFPPWRASDDGGRTYRPAGYGFIGASPVGRKEHKDQLQREVDTLVAKRSPPPVQPPRREENYATEPYSGLRAGGRTNNRVPFKFAGDDLPL